MDWLTTEVKPLSANQMHFGRKTDTTAYRKYQLEVSRNLPDLELPDGPLQLELKVHYSNRSSDLDNALKPLIDVLQKRYDFNDNQVYKIVAEKFIVPKGQETIQFRFTKYKGDVC